MKKLGKRLGYMLIAAMLVTALMPGRQVSAAENYADVPEDSWAKTAVYEAQSAGLMSGQGDGLFGYGRTITKAEFVTILCNMFKWQTVSAAAPSFGDVSAEQWYFPYVETALANGAIDQTAAFLPETAITREEMAVMFVRALGLSNAAEIAASSTLPFTDVTTNKGYIAVAYDIGMINGTTDTTFSPADTAKREEAAAMLTRVYVKYYGSTEFLHGFYAISAYSQKDLMKDFDAVTLSWSSMDADGSLIMDSGTYKLPEGYELVTTYLEEQNVKAHLGVYMDRSQGVLELLGDPGLRTEAVEAIMEELSKNYGAIGKNPYSGVTIDFEGLAGADARLGFNAFLTELSGRLSSAGKTLYVAVQPALPDGSYFDGFDYRTIGELADKVILMAHDYNPTSLAGYEGTKWHKNAALTPIGQVYYALKAVTDANTGVADKSKVVLAISFAAVGWELSQDGKLLSPSPAFADSAAVYSRMRSAQAVSGFSQVYRNPYVTYTTDEGRHMFLWYENERSVAEKAALARMLGVDGLSLWRLGNLPNFDGYTVMNSVK